MNGAIKLVVGIVLIVAALLVAILVGSWGWAVVQFLKAIVIVLVIIAGILLIIIGSGELSTK